MVDDKWDKKMSSGSFSKNLVIKKPWNWFKRFWLQVRFYCITKFELYTVGLDVSKTIRQTFRRYAVVTPDTSYLLTELVFRTCYLLTGCEGRTVKY